MQDGLFERILHWTEIYRFAKTMAAMFERRDSRPATVGLSDRHPLGAPCEPSLDVFISTHRTLVRNYGPKLDLEITTVILVMAET